MHRAGVLDLSSFDGAQDDIYVYVRAAVARVALVTSIISAIEPISPRFFYVQKAESSFYLFRPTAHRHDGRLWEQLDRNPGIE